MSLIKPYYKLFLPEEALEFSVQWENCFTGLSSFLADGKFRAFRIHVFIYTNGNKDYALKSEVIKDSFCSVFGDRLPPVAILPQAPEYPVQVMIEAGFFESSCAEIEYHTYNGQNYCQVRAKDYREYWFTGIHGTGTFSNLLDSANKAFSNLLSLFEKAGVGMDQIVRQWNYIGDILAQESIRGNFVQHYQMFNEVRHRYYAKYRDVPGYPAATGIGMDIGGVILDCFAISGGDNVEVISVSNPDQYDSYSYKEEVLVGSTIEKKGKKKHPPQFERAKLIVVGGQSRLLISGTASIRGQDNVGKGDLIRQTEVTIENIGHLISKKNLKRHFPAMTSWPDQYTYVRVYVKNNDDIARIKPVCSACFGDAPISYIQADICRDDLLVEIEAELIN